MANRRPLDAVESLRNTRRSMGDGTTQGRSRIATPVRAGTLKRGVVGLGAAAQPNPGTGTSLATRAGETVTLIATGVTTPGKVEWDERIRGEGYRVELPDPIAGPPGYRDFHVRVTSNGDPIRGLTISATGSETVTTEPTPFCTEWRGTLPHVLATPGDPLTIDLGWTGTADVDVELTVGVVEPLAAQSALPSGIWWTDFSEYEVSTDNPPDWSRIARGTTHEPDPWGIKANAGFTGGKYLYHPSGDGWEWVGWDAPPVGFDMEVVARLASPSQFDSMGVVVRSSAAAGYSMTANPSSDLLAIWRLLDGTVTKLAEVSRAHSSSTFYWLRLRADGNQLRGRSWAASGAEPSEWHIEATDGAITSGRVGIGPSPNEPGSTANERAADVVGIGYGGDTAPMENIV